MIGASVEGEVKRLTVTRLSLAYRRVSFSVLSSQVVSSMVVAALWSTVSRQSLLTWLMTLWSVLMLRYIFARRFLKLDQDADIEPAKWLTGFVIGAAATGLCWGLTVFYFPQSALDQTTILLLFVLIGVSAVASMTMATIPMASTVFLLSSLLPATMWLLSLGERLPGFIAVIGLVYLGLLLLSRQIHRTVLTSLVSTEQNKALTSAVQERDQRTLRFFESAPGCYFTLQRDAEGLYSMPFASPGIMPIFGIDPEDVTENIKPLLQRIQPDDVERLLQELHQSAHMMAPCRFEFRVADSAQGEQWIVLQCQPQEIGHEAVQWHGVMFDISERKRVEAVLKESEARYRDNSNLLHSVLESTSNVLVYALDRNYRYISFNRRHREVCVTSWGKDIAVGMSIFDTINDDVFKEFCRKGYDHVLAGNNLSVESRGKVPRDGISTHCYWENHGSPIRNDEGEIVGLTVFAIEVTASRRAEKSLRVSEERMRLFFERQLVGMAITSPEKGWIQFNDKMCDMLGYSREELARLTWSELTYPDDLAADVAQFERLRHGEIDGYTLEKRFICKNGSLVYTNLSVGCVRKGDRSVDYVLALFEDITERKRMESELANSRNFLNAVINSISDPISVKDEDHRWILLNDTCCAMIGQPREALLGKADYDFLPKEQADVFWEKDDLVCKSGQINVNEEALTDADGNTRHLLTQKSPFTFSDGQRYIVATSRDITERKAIEKALGDSEHMLQDAQRIAHVGSWDVDLVNDRLVWSDEIFRIWEIDRAKFKADFAAFIDTVHPQDRERVSQAYNEAVLNHSLYEVEHRLLFPDGRVKHILERGEPQYDAQGKPVRFIGTALNITERKRMEEQFRMKEYALDHSGDAVFLIDEEARFIYINEQACNSLGYSRAELLEMSTPDIDPDYSLEKAQGANAAAIAEGVITFETRHLRRDGSIFPVEVQLSSLEYGGRTLTMAVVRNITERKRLQNELLEREREFRSLAENLPDNIARWDVEGRYLFVNPVHERTLGIAASDLIGQPIPDTHEHVKAAIAQVVATGQMVDLVRQSALVGDEIQFHEVSLVPEFDAEGRVVSVLGLGRNMTEFYRMQQAVVERERELRALAESSPGMMGTLYSRPDRSICMPYASPKIENLFGLRPEDVVNDATPLFAMNHPDDARRMEVSFAQSARNMTTWHEEYRIIHPTRGERWMESNTHPVPHSDGGIIWYGYIHDITERKRAQQQLELLDRAIDMSADAIFMIDEQLRFAYVNEAACRALGYSREELTAMGPCDIDPDIRREVLLKIMSESPLGLVSTIETRHRTKDGRTYPVEICGVQFEEGGARFGLTVARDITERKQMEKDLKESEARYRDNSNLLNAVLESASDVIVFALDRNYRYIAYNGIHKKVMRAIWGKEISLGMSMLEVIGSHDDFKAAKQGFDRALAGESFVLEETYGDENLSRQYWQNHWAPIRSDAGEVIGLTCFVINITERKQAQLKLELLNRAIDMSGDAIFMFDEQLRFNYVNEAACRALGYSREELTAMGPCDIDPDMPREVILKLMSETKLGLVSTIETRHRAKDGRTYPVEICGVQFEEGGAKFSLAVVRDITERKQAERALHENYDQITALNRSLEETARDMEQQAAVLKASQEQLQRTEAWYRGILQSAPDGMLVVGEQGTITLVNAQLCQMFGYVDDELIGQPIEILVPQQLHGEHVAHRNGFIRGYSTGRGMRGDAAKLKGRRKDGSEFFVDISLSRPPSMDAGAGAICAAIRDVTEQQRLETALAEREHESRTLIDNTPDTIARYNRDGIRIFANKALVSNVEGGAEVLLGKTPSEFPGGVQSETYEAKLREVIASGINTEFELTWPGKNGQEVCSHIRLAAEFDASGTVATVLAVGRDITELNVYRQKIHQMAFHDALTSLPNRALFNDRLRQTLTDALWHEQRAGVMLLDLDRFKVINDSLGHPAGDALLRDAAVRLTDCVRGYDTVARLGGDEFAILLPDIRVGDDLGRIASKILAVFNEPFMLEGKEVFVSTSIGIAVYPNDSADADELVKQADSAMYFAKRSGRNSFRFYSKDLSASAVEKLSLESELRRALERNELELYYQPKIQLANNQLIGSEALLRWNNPLRGMVPPDRFISIAEDCGLIIDIGEWVLRDACRTACDWNATGKPLHIVAINLSARQFQSNDLVETVCKVLETTGCQPQWIELEITESLLLDEQGDVLEMLEAFRGMGISIAIDDFGTGYSSLSYLARFPINTLKIDRSFIRTVTTEHYRAELVKAILSIARCLGQEVVAEGVETPEQAAFLQAHGCQIAQGYLYSKPVPKEAFAAIGLTPALS